MSETKWTKNQKSQFQSSFPLASDKEVSDWQRRGFRYKDAVAWAWWNVTPTRANRYLEAGIHQVPDYFRSQGNMGISRALEWQAAGIEIEEASDWVLLDVPIKSAAQLKGLGRTVREFMAVVYGWGVPSTQAVSWLAAGFDGETARDWIDWKVSCSKAVKFRDDGVHQPPDGGFREAGFTLTEALKWSKGFADFDSASDWISWNVPASVAIDLAFKDIYPPDEGFKDAGLSFDEAMGWIRSGLDSGVFERHDREGRNDWKIWHDAGFTPVSAKKFRSQLIKHINEVAGPDILARDRPMNLWNYDDENREMQLEHLLIECVLSLSEIHKSGMTVSVDNAIEWRGLTCEQILASIDQGIDAETGHYLGNSLLSTDELEMYSLLNENNFYSSPSRYSKCGLKSDDLKKLLKLGVDLDSFLQHCISFGLDGKELTKWAKEFKGLVIGLTIDESGEAKSLVAEWIKYGFSAKEAWLWYSQGFKAEKARAWIKSGATDPIVALRRKNAGLNPD